MPDKYLLKGDIMLDKIKKFVKSVSPLTWILLAIGAFTLTVIWASSNQPKKHHKHEEQKAAAVEAPSAK
jgi:hypothetical protein